MQVAVFPLHTVLFPDGVLPLRVFEARYLDMVRDCLKNDSPFGVCLIRRGSEVGPAAHIEDVGCLASIIGWDMQQLGVLNLRTLGSQRFRVREQRRNADALLVADIELIAPDNDHDLTPGHAPCADLLRRVIDDLSAQRAQAEATALDANPFNAPYRLNSSVWVGNRLCEVLQVPLKAKQKLMELEDASARLDIVTKYLRQHSVFK